MSTYLKKFSNFYFLHLTKLEHLVVCQNASFRFEQTRRVIQRMCATIALELSKKFQ